MRKIKKLRKFIAFTLVFLAVAAIVQGAASARIIGDRIGDVLNTDIKVYIDDVQIAGYNINGEMYVIAEDLPPYGFGVVWNGAERTLSIIDGARAGTPKAVSINTHTPGSVAFPYVYTDIYTYINGRYIISYNVRGSTVVRMDDLANEFGNLTWNGSRRELRLATKYSLCSSGEIARIEEINKMLADIAPKAASVYQTEPDTSAPYNTGKLTREFLNDGLAYVNFARNLAGLPPVEFSDDLNNTAQHGAFVSFAVGGPLTHSPTNTANLPDELFSLGRTGCASSNLGAGHRTLYAFNRSCMDDSDTSNISRVGHRRWLLSPEMKYIGMGYAGNRSASYVFDNSSDFTDWDTINWPPAGLFPKREFGAHTAWSVSLGDNYKTSGDTQVKIVRQTDGKTWTLSQSSAKTGREYFNISGSGMGRNGPCIIFRPDLDAYKIGEAYEVTITGLTGKANILQYTVKFF